ncbi:hypothetical protein BD847_1222 [Flavobacterium cutihirudinis]|uniref:Uncharacterized protein n=1 Tax=Flavobacterium cutihirudinis TaxID=1265740 RepID=A0A3D9FUQ7_9FLAO|nr:hypothetical protein [Flavobacterium cutihirudinis]RED24494.1 hypothetical protein BD847_1222 [Flavobacterium cutihirudinis]
MKNFILSLFVLTGIICHSKNKNLVNITINDSIRIVKKAIKNYENGIFQNEEVLTYTYENGLVSKIVTTTNENVITEDIAIKYENGKLKELLIIYPYAQYKKGDKTLTQLESIMNIVYNYENDLIKSATGYENNKIRQLDYYFYNTSKLVIRKKSKSNDGRSNNTEYTYDDEHNLLKRKESKTSDSYKNYDDKRNPFDLVFPEAYLKISAMSKNNFKSSNSDNNSYTYEYEYNSNNYPTKIIQKSGKKIKSETIIEYASNLN